MQRETVIERYERSMLHGSNLNLCGSKAEKEKDALVLIRYIVEHILEWEPQDAVENMTAEVASAVGIDRLVRSYIIYPVDLDKDEDFGYAVYKAYPGITHYNVEAKIMAVYHDLEQGRRQKFPKKFFDGKYGRYRAGFLLLYIIGANIPLQKHNIQGLYALFADTPTINKMLREWKVYTVCRKLYSSPLEYLHDSLPEELSSEFYYNYYSFMHLFETHEAEYMKDVTRQIHEEARQDQSM